MIQWWACAKTLVPPYGNQFLAADSAIRRSGYAGTTLAEVLVSLMIMAIGMSGLIVLFPISMLRSLQATNLTHATQLRYNMDGVIAALPQLRDGGVPTWVANTAVQQNQLVLPTRSSLQMIALQAQFNAATGATEPDWYAAGIKPGTLIDDPIGSNNKLWKVVDFRRYVVDPLGYHKVSSGMQTSFGNATATYTDSNGNQITPSSWLRLPAYGSTNVNAATEAASLPDTFTTVIESKKVTAPVGGTTVTLNDVGFGLGGDVTGGVPAVDRVVLFDASMRQSVVRWLDVAQTNANAVPPVLNWTNPLPAGFVAARVRVQHKAPRYNWLMSVRRGISGQVSMDLVVYYSRGFSPADEKVYPAWIMDVTDPGVDGKPGISGQDDDNNGTIDDASELGTPWSDDYQRNWMIVGYDANAKPPQYKKGGYVCDFNNLRWYRILDVQEGSSLTALWPATASPGSAEQTNATNYFNSAGAAVNTFVFLQIEDNLQANGNPNSAFPADMGRGQVIFPKGVVDVYPLPSKLPWGN